jgi:peptidyl-prolyl cis-trans isomerase SurA
MNKLPPLIRPLLLTAWLASHLLALPSLAAPATAQADFIVAVVNSEPITNREVQTRFERLWREQQDRGGERPSTQALARQALDMLINEKAQLLQAQDQGIKIDDDQIEQAEANLAAGNQLTPAQFRQRLAQEGLTPETLRQQLRTQMTLSRLREREVDARIRISDAEIDQYLREQSAAASDTPPELNIAQILLAVPEGASEAEVNALQARAREITQRARQGESFAQLAKTFSQAPDKGANGGEMGLKSAERYPELFVEAVRALQPQGVTEPVRSGAGFHVLKLLERRQASAALTVVQTRARHILLRPTAELSREQAVAKLQDVRQQIQSNRVSFARAAQALSQDGSAQQGGDLGWVGPGQFVPEFEQVMNKLPPGQISDPLVSRFGVHILEVTDRRRVAVPEKEQRDLARAALRETRLEQTYTRWTEDVRGQAYVEMRDAPEVQPPRSTP